MRLNMSTTLDARYDDPLNPIKRGIHGLVILVPTCAETTDFFCTGTTPTSRTIKKKEKERREKTSGLAGNNKDTLSLSLSPLPFMSGLYRLLWRICHANYCIAYVHIAGYGIARFGQTRAMGTLLFNNESSSRLVRQYVEVLCACTRVHLKIYRPWSLKSFWFCPASADRCRR